jgi:hypothetical protein
MLRQVVLKSRSSLTAHDIPFLSFSSKRHQANWQLPEIVCLTTRMKSKICHADQQQQSQAFLFHLQAYQFLIAACTNPSINQQTTQSLITVLAVVASQHKGLLQCKLHLPVHVQVP